MREGGREEEREEREKKKQGEMDKQGEKQTNNHIKKFHFQEQ
jgi:hypothetical protein